MSQKYFLSKTIHNIYRPSMAQFETSFKRKVDGSLVLSDSSEALLVRQEHRERAYQKPESAEIIRKRAIAKVKQQNGDTTEKKNILSQWTIEFGQFRYFIIDVVMK